MNLLCRRRRSYLLTGASLVGGHDHKYALPPLPIFYLFPVGYEEEEIAINFC